MKKKRYFLITCLAAAVLLAFSACSQDEIVGGGDSLLPDGQYPLLIGDVSIVVQSSEEPWTRVAENTTDGNSSVWENGDEIGVRLDGTDNAVGSGTVYSELGEYRVSVSDGKVSLSAVKEIYWRNHFPVNRVNTWQGIQYRDGAVTAWFPSTDGNIDLKDQSTKLAYVLRGTIPGDDYYYYYEAIPLTFTHQLAKVRVALEGERVSQVTKVEVYGYTSCTNTQGTVTTNGASQGWITMHNPTEYGNGMYWEANLVPGTIQNNFVRLNGTTEVPISTLTELKAGKLHTVTVTVRAYPSDATQITSSDAISDNGNYYVTGNLTSAINITGGSPHIYLYNANITNSAGSAISITGNATPTIHVVGANNNVSSSNGAGIYVAQNATVTITGSSRDDELTATGGGGGAGIGGYVISNNNGANCGNIKIGNVTVYSYGSRNNMGDISAGIGSASGASCGTITIDNATVHAYGTSYGNNIQYTPGIGCGYPFSGTPRAIPIVNISNQSEIHAHRGGVNTDYIGWAGDRGNITNANSTINLGGGTCTGSTVYCYTGTSTTTDTVVEY